MKNIVARFAVLIGLLFAAPTQAQEPVDLLVSADWLKEHIVLDNLVLLHVGEREEYDAGHIPGARFIELDMISKPGDLALEMPEPEELRATLEGLGISDNSHVVVYFGDDWITPSTRILLTLDYAGLGQRSSLLNGGMPAWVRAQGAVTAEKPTVQRGRLSARAMKSDMILTADAVQRLPARGTVLVDARPAVYYAGTSPAEGPAGHIDGALSIPYTTLINDELIIDRAALERAYRAAGVRPGDTVVGYCFIGQYATAMLFGARLLGHQVKLYDGSMQDWNNRGLPLVKSAGR